MKAQAFDPLFMYMKTSNTGLKLLIPSRVCNGIYLRPIHNNRPAGNSLRLSYPNRLSRRSFSHLSNSTNLVSKTNCSYNKHAALSIRAAHTDGNDGNQQSKSLVLYIQNPFRWLVNKLDFTMLRRAWDPSFKENEFKEGAKLAVTSITHLMSSNNFGDLEGLLTSSAINQLRHEVETKWSDVQRRHVSLTKEDIKAALPQRVRFQKMNERKICDVDMLFLALKQSDYDGTNATIFMEIKVRFHRDYTEGLPPEWTVSMFRVTRFSILPR